MSTHEEVTVASEVIKHLADYLVNGKLKPKKEVKALARRIWWAFADFGFEPADMMVDHEMVALDLACWVYSEQGPTTIIGRAEYLYVDYDEDDKPVR